MSLTYDDSAVQRLINNTNRNLLPYAEDILRRIGLKILARVQTNLSGRVLQKRSGRLYNSWGLNIRPSGPTEIEMTVGSIKGHVPYAEIHDKGGRTGRGHKTVIPARQYYSTSPSDVLPAVDRIIARQLKSICG